MNTVIRKVVCIVDKDTKEMFEKVLERLDRIDGRTDRQDGRQNSSFLHLCYIYLPFIDCISPTCYNVK